MIDDPLSLGEMNDLDRKLGLVPDLVVRLAVAVTETPAQGFGGVSTRTPPRSRPPINFGAQSLIDRLSNELTTTVRHVCEHHDTEPPTLWLSDAATWLRDNRDAIATMPDAREIHEALCTVIESCASAVGRPENGHRLIKPEMIAAANRIPVTAGRVEKLAYKLGDQAKGLTRKRVDYLRRAGYLAAEWDEESRSWRYLLGDVLSAHRAAKEARKRPKVSS